MAENAPKRPFNITTTSDGEGLPLTASKEVKITGKVEDMGGFLDFYEDHFELDRDSFLSRFQEPFLMQNCGFIPANALVNFLHKLVSHYIGSEDEPPFNINVWALKETSLMGGPATLTIGRGPDNDVTIHSKRVSKCHAMLVRPTDRWMISDNHSTNGTIIHGERIEADKPHPLGSGCEVNFGHGVSLNFVETGDMHNVLQQIRSLIDKANS